MAVCGLNLTRALVLVIQEWNQGSSLAAPQQPHDFQPRNVNNVQSIAVVNKPNPSTLSINPLAAFSS
jgi:hypothetical protein